MKLEDNGIDIEEFTVPLNNIRPVKSETVTCVSADVSISKMLFSNDKFTLWAFSISSIPALLSIFSISSGVMKSLVQYNGE